ncbi:MAG: hypothetical protein E7058_01150 [Lentisphaerae bacterium]|nr:hypothetical protein [Lentisphaerota bacterium]
MRKLMIIAILAAAGQLSAEIIPVESYKHDIKFLADKRNRYNDDKFIRLTNGTADKEPIVMDFKTSRIRKGVLIFNLKNPAQLTAVNFDIFRGPRSFGWKTVKVFGIDGENKTLLGEKTFNHPYALPAGAKGREKLQMELKCEKKYSAVEIEFSLTGSYLGLLEVSFEGVL